MASLMNLALSAGGIFTKYLNKIFVITREISVDNNITTNADYSELGVLLWLVIIIGLVLPIVVIIKFNPEKN